MIPSHPKASWSSRDDNDDGSGDDNDNYDDDDYDGDDDNQSRVQG